MEIRLNTAYLVAGLIIFVLDIALAAAAEDAELPCLRLKQIDLADDAILSERQQGKLFAPYLGRCIDSALLQAIVERVSSAYMARGYVATRPYLKQQKVDDGQIDISVLKGDPDINAGLYQVRRGDDPLVQDRPDYYIPIEEAPFYDSLPAESKAKLEGRMITARPVAYDESMATTQVFGNGQSNTLPQAIVNGMEQTGADTLNILYNPSRGIVADTLESFVDKSTPLTTGMAKVYGENLSNVIQVNQSAGINTNVANHSQANILFVGSVEYVGAGNINPQGAGGGDDPEGRRAAGITINAYGSPVGVGEIESITRGANLIFSGSHVNRGDGVATVLGGNAPGTSERATLGGRIQAVPDLGQNIIGSKYGDNPSGHSTYTCRANCGNDGNLTPEQLEAQRRDGP